MSRYARQISLPEIGVSGQERLARARVLVIGAGGLAAGLLPALIGAGVGAVEVMDHDEVELSNLHRQTLFRAEDIGQPKALCAVKNLRGLNEECRLTAHVARMDPARARQMIEAPRARFDVVIDAADSAALTYAVSDVCARAGVPLISASVLGRQGMVGGFCGAPMSAAPDYRSVFPDLPMRMQTCAQAGVMGPAVVVMGALQAQMTLSVLLDHTPSPLGQMMSVDLATWRVSSFRFDGDGDGGGALGGGGQAADAPEIIALSEITPEDIVIELRGQQEAPAPAHPAAMRILPDDLAQFTPSHKGRIVLICASGLRAWHGARALQSRFDNTTAIVAAG
ncbi:HesA/MoeB/ThiF family protein [Albirhodobacter sp. R86504]|uniref:HesA/MoeB/ThiF family protein n=1 Tax=Albirhodobacter sp. R86504 TaxID=3093848 RepID=UPI00366ECA64